MADDFGNITIAVPLVTLQQIKDQLRLTGTAQDAVATMYGAVAQDEILSYLKQWADPAWTEATVPLPVKAQILRRAAFHFRNRGDDDLADGSGGANRAAANWEEIARALDRYRDPAVG